jgi:hypothetical protein
MKGARQMSLECKVLPNRILNVTPRSNSNSCMSRTLGRSVSKSMYALSFNASRMLQRDRARLANQNVDEIA